MACQTAFTAQIDSIKCRHMLMTHLKVADSIVTYGVLGTLPTAEMQRITSLNVLPRDNVQSLRRMDTLYSHLNRRSHKDTFMRVQTREKLDTQRANENEAAIALQCIAKAFNIG